MCHSRGINNKINNIHKIALRIVYQNKKSNYRIFYRRTSLSIHMKKLQYLATEMYKVKNCLPPEVMREVFNFQENEITILGAVHI